MTQRVLVIGTGLIGTSAALALRARNVQVWLSDADPSAAALAASMGAGVVAPDPGGADPAGTPGVDIAILAVPPESVAPTLVDAQARHVARWYTDVASVKQLPVDAAIAAGCDMTSFVPGHPLAGREKHGPAAARADLFLGRTWALCPSGAAPQAVEAITALVLECGAVPVRTDPGTHDRWVALISHAPHLVAAAMAAQLEPADPAALELAGQGIRDVTRVAAGEVELWTQILAANAGPVAAVLAEVAADLADAARQLVDGQAPKDLLDRGRTGVSRIPGKHGGMQPSVALVQVVIRDEPGELARLFNAAGAAGVNIEDIRIEHSPGMPVGVAELQVRPADATTLSTALSAAGWPTRC